MVDSACLCFEEELREGGHRAPSFRQTRIPNVMPTKTHLYPPNRMQFLRPPFRRCGHETGSKHHYDAVLNSKATRPYEEAEAEPASFLCAGRTTYVMPPTLDTLGNRGCIASSVNYKDMIHTHVLAPECGAFAHTRDFRTGLRTKAKLRSSGHPLRAS